MKIGKKRISAEQYFNDMSDTLAAFRSVLGWIFFVIAVFLAFTCIFNLFYQILPLDGVYIKGYSSVDVLTEKNVGTLSAGDVVLVKKGSGYVCAEVKDVYGNGSKVPEGFVMVSSNYGKNRECVSYDSIRGKVSCIVYPSLCFGEDAVRAVSGSCR